MSLLANGWARCGVEVTMVTVGSTAADVYELDGRVDRIGLDMVGKSASPIAAALNNLRRIRRLRATIRELRPDVLISFLTSTNSLTVLAARPLGVPVIVSERVWPEADHIGRVWRYVRRYTYRRAALVVAQTHRTAEWLREEMREAVVEVVANPVDVDPREDVDEVAEMVLASRQGHNLVVSAGRLSEQKGFDLLIRAFAPIARRRGNWLLAIFGEGNEREALSNLCQELGISRRVMFPGFTRALHVMMRRAQLFVLPSRYEGMPNVLVEAMSCGVPCVSFDCPTGPAELISHGRNGLLVPAEDISGLGGAMDALMEDESMRRRLGKAAQASAKEYSVDNILSRWNTLLTRAVDAA